jgi:hypothetical protein
MDGRITHGPTPEARIAAVVRSVILLLAHPVPDRPDYADLAEWLCLYLAYEFVIVRLEEAPEEERKRELRAELDLIEARFGDSKYREEGATPEVRLAKMCHALMVLHSLPAPARPTERDLAEWLQIYLKREFLIVRFDEAKKGQHEQRQRFLREEIVRTEVLIAHGRL